MRMYSNDAVEREDIASLYATVANPNDTFLSKDQIHRRHCVTLDGIEYVCVYTDGSASMTAHDILRPCQLGCHVQPSL